MSWLSPRLRRALVLVGIAIALELVLFLPYFTGSAIPPWDFLGSYSTDAYLWWSQGGFFTPLDWIPNLWAGYPSALNLQNSAWYLPVGIASLFGDPSLQSAAILGALHVALGFAGTYRLSRSLQNSFTVSLIVATAGFFAVGYFSNAEHIDIARAYALVPWILLVLSPQWPWRRWWAVPVATLVVWQSVTGIYPGMIVTTLYVGVVWIAVQQWRTRAPLRAFLLPLAISAVAAVLLSMPRLLPYLLTQEAGGPALADTSQFSLAMVGTLQFGYTDPVLPNDITMRSFFIPATMIVLALFARFSHVATRQALALGVPAALLGLPFLPWFDAAQALPGLGLSRFTMSDFKVFLVLAVLLLASSGLRALVEVPPGQPLGRPILIRLAAAMAVVLGLTVIGVLGPYSGWAWVPGALALLGSVVAVGAYLLWRSRAVVLPRGFSLQSALAGVLVVLTLASGVYWALSNQLPWREDRIAAEQQAYGATVTELLAERVDYHGELQRPARLAPVDGYTLSDLRGVIGNRVYYTGQYSLGGYLNLKGSLTPAQLEAALTDPTSGPQFAEFLTAPGLVFFAEDVGRPSGDLLAACASEGECGAGVASPAGYEAGRLTYEISMQSDTEVLLNEAYYPGWRATACEAERCTELSVQRNDQGLLRVDLPAGDYKLNLEYQTPGRAAGWIGFGLGLLLVLASLLLLVRGRRTSETKLEVDQ